MFVPFSSFTSRRRSQATFTNAGAIKSTINGAAAMDAQVANIDAIGPTVMVQNFANSAQTDLAIVKTGEPNPVLAGATYDLHLDRHQ